MQSWDSSLLPWKAPIYNSSHPREDSDHQADGYSRRGSLDPSAETVPLSTNEFKIP